MYKTSRKIETLTEDEARRLLKVTRQHRNGGRDHLILGLALGTGLRLSEIVGLNAGDLVTPEGRIRGRVRLRPETTKCDRGGEVFIPESLQRKLREYVQAEAARRPAWGPESPLFASNRGRRISGRTVQHSFRVWQQRAGFDRRYNFHALRHTYLTGVYRRTKDLILTQRAARHASPSTTSIYTHASAEELWESVKGIPC